MTTVVPSTALGSSYPPSSGAFTQEASSVMPDILKLLASTLSPLMINVYPYFAYKSDPAHVPLDYAQFTSEKPVVRDGNFNYFYLFDAIVDAFLAAINGQSRQLACQSCGVWARVVGLWTGTEISPLQILQRHIYNRNFMYHCLNFQGRGHRKDRMIESIEAFVSAMFNENQKPNGEEQHFGLFYPNMKPVYYVPFSWPKSSA